jgi:hypothetical protein
MGIASYGTTTRATYMLCAAASAAPAFTAAAEQPLLRDIAHAPDPGQLQATVQALVGFGTRHSLSTWSRFRKAPRIPSGSSC